MHWILQTNLFKETEWSQGDCVRHGGAGRETVLATIGASVIN